MSKNFTAKTSTKWLLLSIITVVITLIGVIVLAVANINNETHVQSSKMLTVSVTRSTSFYEDEKEEIKAICESVFEKTGVEPIREPIEGDVSTLIHEIVYDFSTQTNLTETEEALNEAFAETSFKNYIQTSVNSKGVVEKLPGGQSKFLFRTLLSGVLFAVIALIYVSLRYKLWNGIVTFLASGSSAAITCAFILITRIPVNTAVVYAVLFAIMLTTVLCTLFAAKNAKAEAKGADLTQPESLSETVPVCDACKIGGALTVVLAALAVVGICMASNFAWFALACVYAVIAAGYSALLLAPALFVILRKKFAASQANKSRYDYKKGKKSKKTEQPVAASEKDAE